MRRIRPSHVVIAAVGLAAAMLGTTFAAGIDGTGTASSNQTASSSSPDFLNFSAGTSSASAYSAVALTKVNDVSITWKGAWGSIGDHSTINNATKMYDVNLSATSLPTGTYYFEVALTNSAFAAPYDAAQLQFVRYDTSCTSVVVGTTPQVSSQVMYADNTDAKVVFTGLTKTTGNYCVAVAQAGTRADDSTATFLRRQGPAFPDALTFVGLVNRSGP